MTRLWVDAFGFASRVLNAGRDPWAEPAQLGAMLKDLERLLGGDVIVLPFDSLFDTWLPRAANPAHNAEAFSRLIAQSAFASAIATGLASIRAARLSAPIALAFPGPTRLLGGGGAMSFDDADLVFTALCTLVRNCGAESAHAILLEEADAVALEPADALINVAAHLGLAPALRSQVAAAFGAHHFAPRFQRDAEAGADPWLGAAWMKGDAPLPSAPDVLVTAPEECAPELARARLRAARGRP